jgi:hypothetical protein
MARQVGDDDAVASRERRCKRPPVLDRPAQAVHEHERRSSLISWPSDGVTQTRPAPLDLPFLESLQPVFAVRPH